MKYNFQRILVPVDGSPQSIVAFRAAATLCKAYASQLTALHIAEDGVSEEGLRKMMGENTQGVSFHYMHKKGTVHKEILHAAQETDTELIVMGTHGVSGFQEFWMGSNAYKVVNSAHSPVLTMREDSRISDFKNIILPIDTSFESRQKVPVAISIAKHFNSTVHILGVSSGDDKDAEYKVKAFTRQVIHSLDDAHVPHTFNMQLGGNLTDITINYAKQKNADLIIIMTEQELQLGSFFLGKFAQQMVNHSPVPVLSIPPREDLIVTEARL
ncbi:MAG: universal stress protein [Bacteroidota bacterium]|jgi:nucleotide-binding universal stress UspA family protein